MFAWQHFWGYIWNKLLMSYQTSIIEVFAVIYKSHLISHKLWVINSVIAWKSKKRHNFALDQWISILKKLVIRTRVHTNVYRKNMPHGVLIDSKIWRHFWPWIVKNVAYIFSIKVRAPSSSYNPFFQNWNSFQSEVMAFFRFSSNNTSYKNWKPYKFEWMSFPEIGLAHDPQNWYFRNFFEFIRICR